MVMNTVPVSPMLNPYTLVNSPDIELLYCYSQRPHRLIHHSLDQDVEHAPNEAYP